MRLKTIMLLKAAAVLAVSSLTNIAHATLIGDSIVVEWENQNNILESHPVVVVDPGAELDFVFVFGTNQFRVDVGASTISVEHIVNNISFNSFSDHFIFSDLDWVGMPSGIITGLAIQQTGVSGLSATFTDHSVSLDVTGSSWNVGDNVLISLTTSHIPEPATLVLMGLGLVGLGFVRHGRRLNA